MGGLSLGDAPAGFPCRVQSPRDPGQEGGRAGPAPRHWPGRAGFSAVPGTSCVYSRELQFTGTKSFNAARALLARGVLGSGAA